jgi:hypothetical protein
LPCVGNTVRSNLRPVLRVQHKQYEVEFYNIENKEGSLKDFEHRCTYEFSSQLIYLIHDIQNSRTNSIEGGENVIPGELF